MAEIPVPIPTLPYLNRSTPPQPTQLQYSAELCRASLSPACLWYQRRASYPTAYFCRRLVFTGISAEGRAPNLPVSSCITLPYITMASPSPPREAATTERNWQRRMPKSIWWLIMIIFLVILNTWYSTTNFLSSATREKMANEFSKRVETTTNLDGNNQDIRIIALCGDATFF